MDPVRYGIVGLGQIAVKGHIPSLKEISGARVVAVSDIVPEALEATSKEMDGVRAYSDYKELLADDAVEAVVVATPNWLHREQAIAAFAAGKHVFCEKPLGIDLIECDAILAAQKASGKVLQVGHELRYANLLVAMHDKIKDGLIGSVQMVVISEFRFPLLPGWRQTGKTGGVMLEKNSHFFDVFNWFAGARPVRVVGVGGNNVNKDSPLVDHCIVNVEYANRAKGTLVMCLFAEHGSDLTIDVVGDKGRLITYFGDHRLLHYSRTEAEPQEWTFEKGADGAFHAGFKTEHEAFIRSVREGEPVRADGASAREVLCVAAAAERAVAGETVVAID